MATLSAATGLVVAIPLYYKIQDELRKNFSKLADLSGFMTQLISKLGISDASFTKELANGYQVVFENGKTKIFKTINGERSLVMNTNADGTIGSAARYDGVAAKQIISVVTDAVAMIGSDAQAMSDILGPIAEEAEKTSVEIESAITGTPKEVLLLRNKIAGKTDVQIAAEGIVADPAILAKAKQAAIDAKAEADAFKTMTEEQRKQKEAEAILRADADKLKIAYIKYIKGFSSGDIDKDNNDAKNDPLWSKTIDEVKLLFNQEQAQRASVSVQASQEKTTERAMSQGSGQGSTNLINNIISSPARFVNIFSRTFGFAPTSGTQVGGTDTLRKSIYSVLESVWGNRHELFNNAFNPWIDLIGRQLLGYDASILRDWTTNVSPAKRKVQATEILNTTHSLTTDEKGLIILSVKITEADNSTIHNGYIIGHVAPDSPSVLGWKSTKALFDIDVDGKGQKYTQDKLDSIRYLSRIAASDVHPLVKKEVIQKLISISEGKTQVSSIRDVNFINKLNAFSNHLSTINDKFAKNFFSTITFDVSKETLYNGRLYDFDIDEFIKATNLVAEHDGVIYPDKVNSANTLSTFDQAYLNPREFFGDWMLKLEKFIENQQSSYSKYIKHLANFYDLIKSTTVNPEIQAMMDLNRVDDYQMIIQDSQAVIDLLTTSDAVLHDFVTTLNRGRDELFNLSKAQPNYSLLKDHIRQIFAIDKTKAENLVKSYWPITKFLLISNNPDITHIVQLIENIIDKGIHQNILDGSTANAKYFSQTGMKALEILASDESAIVKLTSVQKSGSYVFDPQVLFDITEQIGAANVVATFDLFKKHIEQLMQTNEATSLKLIKDYPDLIKYLLLLPEADITHKLQFVQSIMNKNIHTSVLEKNNFHKYLEQTGMKALEILASDDANIEKLLSVQKSGSYVFTPEMLFTMTNEIGNTGKPATLDIFVNHIKQWFTEDETKAMLIVENYSALAKFLLLLPKLDITSDAQLVNKIITGNTYLSVLSDANFLKYFTQTQRYALSLLISTNSDVIKMLEVKDEHNNLVITPEILLTWTNEIGQTGFANTFDLFNQHIKQLMNHINAVDTAHPMDVVKAIHLIKINYQFIGKVLTSPKSDITFEVQDAVKLMKTNPLFDMTDPNNIKKVQAASGVSEALSTQGLSSAQVDVISDKVRKALTTEGDNALTPEEFKQVVEYTNTVFSVFSDSNEAVAQLNKVLDPTKLKANVAKINQFNKWIAEIKKIHIGNGPITQKEIEEYVWTYKGLEVHDSPVIPGTTVNAQFTSIIPTTTDGLTTVIHAGGGLYQINPPATDNPAPKLVDIFEHTSDTPLNQGAVTKYSSTGGYDSVHNAIVSGDLVMSGNAGRIILWDLNHKEITSKIFTIKNAHAHATYIRNIIISKSGKIILIDESAGLFTLSAAMGDLMNPNFNAEIQLQQFASSAGNLHKVFAVDTYVAPNGNTYAVISDNKGTSTPQNRITVLNLDTGALVSQTDVGDYFYGLSVDQNTGYAYGIGEAHKQLWRIDIMNPANTQALLKIDDLKDQDGNSNPVPEAGTTFRGIFYDNVKREIVVSSASHLIWIADNTQELEEIFNFLMKH